MPNPTVDEWVQRRVEPELVPIVDRIRALMREIAPEVEEKVSYNMPAFCGKHLIIAYITAAKAHITFSFTVGVNFEDKYGKLKGTAKHARYLRYRSVGDIDEKLVKYYVRQAVKHDRR
jgi:hypothetical protein